MTTKLAGRLIAIPSAHTALGEELVDLLLPNECRMALGSSPARFQMLDDRIDGRERVYCQPVDLDRPGSVGKFFQITFAQLGSPDIVVLEVPNPKTRRKPTEQLIEVVTQRLLHCLDAALPFIGGDLHVMLVAPSYGQTAIPVATAFLGAKFAAKGKAPAARVRMSVVSPCVSPDDASLAGTIVHMLGEAHYPDVTETVLWPKDKQRGRAVRSRVSGATKIDAGPS